MQHMKSFIQKRQIERDRDMTEKDYIRAAKCCQVSSKGISCERCPLYRDEKCIETLSKEMIAINNSQKAEIAKKDTEIDILIRKKESLRDEISELKAEIERLEFSNEHWNDWEVKCRAIKEFAERLKRKAYIEGSFMTFSYDTIENLVKEMTEE